MNGVWFWSFCYLEQVVVSVQADHLRLEDKRVSFLSLHRSLLLLLQLSNAVNTFLRANVPYRIASTHARKAPSRTRLHPVVAISLLFKVISGQGNIFQRIHNVTTH